MIDWFDKLPDSMTGLAFGCAVWLGFNYVVLAPRAIEKDASSIVMESCLATIARHEATVQRRLDAAIGAIGGTEVGTLVAPLLGTLMTVGSSPAERTKACECALTATRVKLRFDYAVHTATLRLVTPQSVSAFESDTVALLFSGACGTLPGLTGGT